MRRAITVALMSLTTLGCPGPKGDTGETGHTLRVFDASSVELGTLVGTSMTWMHSSSGFPVPGGQAVSYQDASGVIWNVGIGGGAVQLPNVALYFASADCTGPVLLRNASPYLPVASVVGAPPLKGVYQATTTASVSPQSWIAATDPGDAGPCIASAPPPNPAPQVTLYRNANRLGSYPMTPKPAPLTIGP